MDDAFWLCVQLPSALSSPIFADLRPPAMICEMMRSCAHSFGAFYRCSACHRRRRFLVHSFCQTAPIHNELWRFKFSCDCWQCQLFLFVSVRPLLPFLAAHSSRLRQFCLNPCPSSLPHAAFRECIGLCHAGGLCTALGVCAAPLNGAASAATGNKHAKATAAAAAAPAAAQAGKDRHAEQAKW